MNRVITEENWIPFLKKYNSRNQKRPTRLGVFEMSSGNANDFWIEDGMPLIAVDAYEDRGRTRVDLLFKDYAHPIEDVTRIVDIENYGQDQGLDIADRSGRTTVLRFEDWPTREQ
jgi:hypothetical protein